LFDAGVVISGNGQLSQLEKGKIKNAFIFGEDPLGCASDKEFISGLMAKLDFTAVQDYFMTDTAFAADLILPASLPIETGGSFTNTQRFIQQFAGSIEPKTKPSFTQIAELNELFEVKINAGTIEDVMADRIRSLVPQETKDKKYTLIYTGKDNFSRMFKHGCDALVKRFDDEFEEAFRLTGEAAFEIKQTEYEKI
jgi:formate dehydrogenase major subunit